MKSGQYSETELMEVRAAAQDIAKNAGTIRVMAQTLSEKLDRSERSLSLMLGREVSRLTPPARRGRPRLKDTKDVVALVRKATKLAGQVDDLGRERAKLDRELKAKITELAKIREQLMKQLKPSVEDEILAPPTKQEPAAEVDQA